MVEAVGEEDAIGGTEGRAAGSYVREDEPGPICSWYMDAPAGMDVIWMGWWTVA